MLKIKEAKKELEEKSYRDIQEETAWKWSSRGAASYQNVLTAPRKEKMPLYLLAEEYCHEGREHAAIVPHALKAWENIQEEFGI
jgi:hypothetical protein